ncbi:hypothetical protein APTSU1_000707600 [Apodemus speciosus]|uniref:Uncharacterized protein n=1 Tax=Apodemus speciosus TaxID=105296 RepID=A0ABQ0EXS3_APOSI
MLRRVLRPAESVRSPGTGAIGGRELPDVGAAHQTASAIDGPSV